MTQGIMLHAELADYYDFLGLRGYKRLHEYHFLAECAELRGLHRYYINHEGALLQTEVAAPEPVTPPAWYAATRDDVSVAIRRDAVREGMDTWVDWERKTKAVLQLAYSDLMTSGSIAAACKIREILSGADQELKKAERMVLELKACDYDPVFVVESQEHLHECYRAKTKDIGVDIC
jgi:hypothetical protein